MSSSVIESGQQLGHIKSLFSNQYLSLSSEFFNSSDEAITLKDLLTQIILDETNAFETRQIDGKLTYSLTKVDIEKGGVQGKIEMEDRDVIQEFESETLVKNALRAFEDGCYFVLINDIQGESLGQLINLESNS